MRKLLIALPLTIAAFLLSSFVHNHLDAEYGKASYYADSLHGRPTASGETCDKNKLTCAHKSLPFGTMVRVTRLDNGKSVVVRVNDRGPFVEGYIVDISRKAAAEIGLIRDGITRVKLEVEQSVDDGGKTRLLMSKSGSTPVQAKSAVASKSVEPAIYSSVLEPAKVTLPAQSSSELFSVNMSSSPKAGYGVQVSTLFDADNVIPTLSQIQRDWPGKSLVLIDSNERDNTAIYKIIIGPYADKSSAEAQRKLAARKGFNGCFIVDLSSL